MTARTRVAVVAAVAVALPGALAATAAAQTQPVFVNGQAQVVPAMNVSSEWIRHRLWVETEFDSDGDGKRDRMHVDVTRPAQTNTEGLRVPVVYETSPYYAGTGNTNAQYLWNVNHELGVAPQARISGPPIAFNPNRTSISTSEVNTWVPRGFAVVHSESPGSGLSQGCPTVGGSNENDGPKAVIDWLNGRAKGFTTIDGTTEVTANWATGKVGMTGTSYNGTLPISAATTGVAGLEAIIPIAPNTSYYHYYRSNGLVRNPGGWVGEDIDFLFDYINSGDPARRQYCIDTVREGLMKLRQDRTTGDYNDFWAGRDQLNQLANVKAATLMAHAFNDWNVVPEHSVRIAEALKGKVPLQQFYHQGGHGGAPPLGLRNRWFTRFLYGVQNGVENDPKAWVTREAAACPPRTAAVVGDQSNTATLTVASSSQLQVGMTLTIPQTNAAGTTTNVSRAILAIPNATTVTLDSAVATAAGDKIAAGATLSIVCSQANPTPYGDYPNPSLEGGRAPAAGRREHDGRVELGRAAGGGARKARRRRVMPAGQLRHLGAAAAPVLDAELDGTAAPLGHAQGQGADGGEQGGREPLRLARRAAVHAVGDVHLDVDQHVARHHARVGGPAEPRRGLGRLPARAGRVRRRLVQPAADGQGRPPGAAARADGLLERPPLHAAAAARHRGDRRSRGHGALDPGRRRLEGVHDRDRWR